MVATTVSEYETVLSILPRDGLHGRRKIYSDYEEVTKENVAKIVSDTNSVHLLNKREIQYLYDVYRGKQDVRHKTKQVRPEINNVVMVNRANEIVTFKVSYLLGEPVQYVSRGGRDDVSEEINKLNEYMYAEDKAAKDKEIADWLHICGVGCRMVLPDPVGEEDGSPAVVYTLDPREAFVIYSSGIGHKPLAGVLRRRDADGNGFFEVYTPYRKYRVHGEEVAEEEHTLGIVPMIEYVHNEARMGAFEVVLPLLNAINTLESNRVDSVQDFVNAFDVFQNCELDKGQYSNLSAGGMAIQIKSCSPGMEAKVYRIASELSQQGVQTAIDDAYDAVLTICGMPNRNGGSSTSDTGAATIMRDGWQSAETRALDTETLWSRSEREFLRIVLKICSDVKLKLSDIGIKFTRRNYSDIQSKAQVLAEMLNNSKIHPKLAFQACGLFSDAEDAYRMSMEYSEEQQEKMERSLTDELQDDGQGHEAAGETDGAPVRSGEEQGGGG